MDVEKLKQKILDLAIRGKLVPQDPNDEPASVLIEKIKAEKAKLVKEGKIKASKEESYIFKGSDNFYYENLPDNWAKSNLRNVIVLQCGIDLQLKLINNDKKGIPYITGASNFKDDGLIINRWTEYPTNVSSQGDILITVKGTIGDVSFNNIGDVHIARQIMSLAPIKGLLSKYLYYVILANKRLLIEKRNGIIPGITKESILSLKIGVPPENEQRRIVDKIDNLFNIINQINKDQESIRNIADYIKHKILDTYFGENSSYKSYYENEYSLGELLQYKQPGPFIVKSTEYNDSYKVPVLTPGKSFILGYTNETDGVYRVNGKQVIIFDDFTTASRLIGFDFKVKSSAMKILTNTNDKKFNTEYLYYLLQTIYINNDTHKRYWISEYAPIKLKIHTYDEQNKIVSDISKINDILNCI